MGKSWFSGLHHMGLSELSCCSLHSPCHAFTHAMPIVIHHDLKDHVILPAPSRSDRTVSADELPATPCCSAVKGKPPSQP